MAARLASSRSRSSGWCTATSTTPSAWSTWATTRKSARASRWPARFTATPVGSGTGGTESWNSQMVLSGGAAAIHASV